VKRPYVSWSLRRDLHEIVTAQEESVYIFVLDASDCISVTAHEEGYEIRVSDRSSARLLAKRINQCLDGTTRHAMRVRRRS
jgi:hypothetical protein